MGSLILALRFLTVVPIPGPEAEGPSALGRAAWWFPVVGLLLGGVLALAGRLADALWPPLVGAALLVAAWKVATGGIHLDGLADSLDGLAGRDAARRIVIMRDSRTGVFGAAGLILLLLLAVAALAGLSASVRLRVLVLAPVIGRVTPLLAGAWLAPATPGQGLGAAFAAGLSRWAGIAHALAACGLAAWLLGVWGVAAAAAGWAVALLAAALIARRLGGVTGDVLGAVVELAELGTLLGAAAAAHRGLL
ncbi:MAG TPA: adenosylcobinamide-GDP ribazoletransferase [Candidatus Deferrimicrobiaceae bacterium]|nr:adenosylcobinamide-GDP ribazoletransferase [Candidatus Deferrimicrobiaceae bacterium]